MVSGDIAGETLGDVLIEVPASRVLTLRAAEEAAREVVVQLRGHVDEVIRALKDETRRP